jgi:hypothetical protein
MQPLHQSAKQLMHDGDPIKGTGTTEMGEILQMDGIRLHCLWDWIHCWPAEQVEEKHNDL